jgi:hypothetical protein
LNLSKDRKGDEIPQVQDQNAWANLTINAWCYDDNDKSNGKKYGKLCNWFEVKDSRRFVINFSKLVV